MNKFKLLFPAIFLAPMLSLATDPSTYHVIMGIQDVKFVEKEPVTEPTPPEEVPPEEPEEDLTATSCSGLLAKTPSLSNGVHNIMYNGGEVPVYCDMSGGGWTLVGTGIARATAGWSNRF